MVQAAVLDGLLFDASSFGQDCFAATKVDVRRREVADTFMISAVVVVVDDGVDGGCAFATVARTRPDPRTLEAARLGANVVPISLCYASVGQSQEGFML
jgi:hypothetical protein